MGSSCVFCSVIAGETDPAIIFRDDEVIMFLDISPLFHGHTLVVPIEHHERLADLPPGQIDSLFQRVQVLSKVMQDPFGAQGSFVAMNNIVSQSVPHLHVHVVPRTKGDGLKGFFWPRTKYDDRAHMAEVANTLQAAFTSAWEARLTES
ncbi:MAG: histidine triad (HIT) family protein [Verrucomicrobiales bacterium]|jgi:histidine triad (HIT) family protein